jgi:hypothetical protein
MQIIKYSILVVLSLGLFSVRSDTTIFDPIDIHHEVEVVNTNPISAPISMPVIAPQEPVAVEEEVFKVEVIGNPSQEEKHEFEALESVEEVDAVWQKFWDENPEILETVNSQCYCPCREEE